MLLDNIKSASINGNNVKEMWFGGSKIWGGEEVWELIKSNYSGTGGVSYPTNFGESTGGYKKYKLIVTFLNDNSGITWNLQFRTKNSTKTLASIGRVYSTKTITLITDLEKMTYEMTGDYTASGKLDSYPYSFTIDGMYSEMQTMELYGIPE